MPGDPECRSELGSRVRDAWLVSEAFSSRGRFRGDVERAPKTRVRGMIIQRGPDGRARLCVEVPGVREDGLNPVVLCPRRRMVV